MSNLDHAISDASILDIFGMEVNTQASILEKELSAIENKTALPQNLEVALKAINAIQGAAKIVKIEAAVKIASEIQTCLKTLQDEKRTVNATQIQVLRALVALLVRMGQFSTLEELKTWLKEQDLEIQKKEQEISNLFNVAPENPQSVKEDQKTEEPASTEGKTSVQEVLETKETLEPFSPIAETSVTTISTQTTTLQPPVPYLSDTSMLELFRLEVEVQASILNENLLILEQQPQAPQSLEALMRAAHSIKGAARIVQLEPAVRIAHVMEDCFVEAQRDRLVLHSIEIDTLLSAVDLLIQLSQVTPSELHQWLSLHTQETEHIIQQLEAILRGETLSAKLAIKQTTLAEKPTLEVPATQGIETLTPEPIPVTPPPALPKAIEQKPQQERVVRVSAENLNRIMGLAGESLVETNWLQPFADSLLMLKKRQLELSKILEQLRECLIAADNPQQIEAYLESAREKEQECRHILGDRLDALELFARRSANLSDRLYREVIASNMRPFADAIQGFPRMVRDLARNMGKQVQLEIIGKGTPVDRDILKKLEAPLTHILRNAIDHGIQTPDKRIALGKPPEGKIKLEALHRGGMLSITISDDGKGIDLEKLRQKVIKKNLVSEEMATQLSESELLEFLFLPGFSTASQVTEISGRGVGLDIAQSMAQEVGGTIRAFTVLGKETSFHFQLPLTLSVIRTLLVEISGEPYAFPLARIDHILRVPKDEISVVENRQYFTLNDEHIGLVAAYQVLELNESNVKSETIPVVVISDSSNRFGLVVDKLIAERDLVVRPLDPRLGKVQDINAAALMEDGSPVLIVDVADLVRSIDNLLNRTPLIQVNEGEINSKLVPQKKILVVDDSLTVREMERKLLENQGYKVEIAIDGIEGWNEIRSNDYDLVISDIDMPRMTGIELVSNIKTHPRLHSIPVIIVSYKDREEDRLKGLDAGANYYLTKSSFHDNTYLEAVYDLIGEPF